MENEQEKKQEDKEVLPPRQRGRRRWVLPVVVLAIIVGGVVYWRMQAGKESTDDAQINGHMHPISAKVGGTVESLLVKDNQYVEAGAVLLQIDQRDYRVALDKAHADLAETEAALHAASTTVPIINTRSRSQVASAMAGVEQQRATVAASEQEINAAESRQVSAQAAVVRARANYELAIKDLERYKALVEKEEIARQQYDAQTAAATAAKAQLDAAIAQEKEAEQGVRVAEAKLTEKKATLVKAEADLRGAQTAPQQVTVTKAQASSSSARVMQAKAAVEQAELNLSYTTVKAPVSGYVSQRTVEVGQNVQAGQPLLALVSLSDIWITANFKENQITNMQPGQDVNISVDAYPDRTYHGKVDSLAAATGEKFSLLPPENATGNFVKVVQRIPVKILLEKGEDKEHRLRPGLSVMPTVMTR